MDPRSNGHKESRNTNLGPLIIAAGIVLAGVVVAFAVVATRSKEGPATIIMPSPAAQASVAPTQPSAQPPPSSPQDPGASPTVESAQAALQQSLAAAQTIHTESGNYSAASSFELATRVPGATFLPASQPSTMPSQVSYYANGNIFAAAAKDTDGSCWWIKDDRTTGKTTYGTGDICTGSSALSATAAAW